MIFVIYINPISFFFRVLIRCLPGRIYTQDKEKLQFYYLLARMYYHMKVYYASLLWEEFTTDVSHSRKAIVIASLRY